MEAWGFPGGTSSKELPWARKIPWRRAWQPTPVFLPGESDGQGTEEPGVGRGWAVVHGSQSRTQLKRLSAAHGSLKGLWVEGGVDGGFWLFGR